MQKDAKEPNPERSLTDTQHKTNALLKLADAAWREFDTRRSFEWKINFALWAGLAAIAGFAIKEDFQVGDYIWVFLGATWAVYIFIWQWGLMNRNRSNQSIAQFYWKRVQEHLGEELPGYLQPRIPRHRRSQLYSHGFQILVTFLFLFAVGYVWTHDLG